MRKPTTKRASQRRWATQKTRKAAHKDKRFKCEACNWAPPAFLTMHEVKCLTVHHVLPVACGGTDHPSNLVLLCPNCHSLAHAIAIIPKDQANIFRGTRNKSELVASLRLLNENPEAWQSQKREKELRDKRKAVDGLQATFEDFMGCNTGQ